jgi:hypothetical protein
MALVILAGGCGSNESSTSATTAGSGGSAGTAGTSSAGGSGGSGGSAGTCDGYEIAPIEAGACNGSAALCDRRFDEAVFATTHNAMSSIDDGWLAPNQSHPVVTQLRDGIRALMLDTHLDADGVPSLCHGSCGFGSKPLTDGLREIATFLKCNPREVVTLVFEAYVTAEQTDVAFKESGLIDLVHTQALGAPWPKLGEMIDQNRRLVALTDDPAGAPAYYHHVWDYAWDTPYAAQTKDDLKCEVGRGDARNALFIFNHFLTSPTADKKLADQVNHNPFFIERAQSCAAQTGDLPNFVTVDFYDVGDVLDVTRTLNGI